MNRAVITRVCHNSCVVFHQHCRLGRAEQLLYLQHHSILDRKAQYVAETDQLDPTTVYNSHSSLTHTTELHIVADTELSRIKTSQSPQ